MLTVSVHEHQKIARCGTDSTFNGSPVADVIRMAQYPRAGISGNGGSVVCGTVIDDDYLKIRIPLANTLYQICNRPGFIEGWNYN
jgi:hypothetical protein